MFGYYEGFGNPARPVTGEYDTLHCADCGVPQTHHKGTDDSWRCVICNAVIVIDEATE
jgi:hypothetical protein